jgi:hypothetical protein
MRGSLDASDNDVNGWNKSDWLGVLQKPPPPVPSKPNVPVLGGVGRRTPTSFLPFPRDLMRARLLRARPRNFSASLASARNADFAADPRAMLRALRAGEQCWNGLCEVDEALHW